MGTVDGIDNCLMVVQLECVYKVVPLAAAGIAGPQSCYISSGAGAGKSEDDYQVPPGSAVYGSRIPLAVAAYNY